MLNEKRQGVESCVSYIIFYIGLGNINVYIHICLYYKIKARTVEEEMTTVSHIWRECKEFRGREWRLNLSYFTALTLESCRCFQNTYTKLNQKKIHIKIKQKM